MKRIFILFFCFIGLQAMAQTRYGVWCSAFYNLENLFDTVDDPNNKGDDEFLPNGPYQWTPEKYQQKLHNSASVIAKIGRHHCPVGPAFIGVSEVENRKVLEDLVARPEVSDMNLKIVHYPSPDHRGIDVALLYNPRLFQLVSSRVYDYYDPERPDYNTRDILLVNGKMGGEGFSAIVSHWPSRYGGKTSNRYREIAAAIVRHIYDSIHVANPAQKVVIMGDLNDDPDNSSCAKVLGARAKKSKTEKGGLYNATWPLFKSGIGSLVYRDKWNLFDQQIISENLLSANKKNEIAYWKAEIFNDNMLLTKEGKYKGYPHRTFSQKVFINGYSDHLPSLLYFIKAIK